MWHWQRIMVLAALSAASMMAALPITGFGATEFHVSTAGDDDADGSAENPFGTLHRARGAVREFRRRNPDSGVTVRIHSGRYFLDRPLRFDSRDSGASAENPVVYRGEGEVELSGGRVIRGWEPDSSSPGLWRTRVEIPDATADDPDRRFEQLWVNGERAVRARTPNWWNFNLLNSVAEEPLDDGTGRVRHHFSVDSADIRMLSGMGPDQLRDIQLMVFHKWDTTREFIESVDVESGRISTLGKPMKSWNRMTGGCLYFLENFRAALDSPGEWFLDRDGWLYYLPRPGEDMNLAQVTAARLPRLVGISGEINNPDAWVRHLYFENLNFRHVSFNTPADGIPPAQAGMNSDATVIQVDGARDIRFTGCRVENAGATAIWFRQACRDSIVDQCRLFDLGVSGVRIGETGLVPERRRTGGITINNCIIHSGGRILPCAVGVWIGHSGDNALTHCDVADFYYTAVSVGWRWGYAESGAHNNRVEFNHLHHIGYRILSDMGGVYTLGPSPGTSVSHNVIHDVLSTRYGGWGLYPDEGSTGILFEGNLVHDVKDGCFHQHYGRDNIVRNNILAFSEEGQIAVTRSEPHLSFTFEKNIVVFDEGHLLGYGGWKSGARVKLHDNLYWRLGGEPFRFGDRTFAEWKASGRDLGSMVADPMFVDAASRNFQLSAESPAWSLGFKPLKVSRAGVYGSAEWRQLAASTTYPEPWSLPEGR